MTTLRPRRFYGLIPARGSIAKVAAQRRELGLGLGRLAAIAVLSVLGGLGQAALLLVLVRAATAVTTQTELISGTVGPFSASDLTISQLVLIGFGVVVFLLITEFLLASQQAGLAREALLVTRTRMVTAYGRASFAEQVSLPRGEQQEVMLGHSAQAAGMASQLAQLVSASLNFLVLVVSAVVISPVAAVAVIVGLGIMAAVLAPVLRRVRSVSLGRINANRAVASALGERLELSREVRAFGTDAESAAPIRQAIRADADLFGRMRFWAKLNSALYRLGASALILGSVLLIDGLGSTNLASLTGAILILIRSMSFGQAAQSAYQQVIERVPVATQLLAMRSGLLDSEVANGTSITPAVGDIEFAQVGFGYGDEPVLTDISFVAPAGRMTAVVGSSGSGKSTIMALLLRLYEPDVGDIRYGGRSVSSLDRESWHRRIAFVPQESKLTSGTVRDAIRFRRPWIDDAAIEAAARAANIHLEIQAWPEGYDTDVGYLGGGISGGQRQRLAIARALAGDPDLLLLDEPTSSLDPDSERLISEAVRRLSGITVIVIAHRLSTVEAAAEVVHIEAGRVVPHAEVPAVDTLRSVLGNDGPTL